jgi:hypothetical protein
MKLKMPSIESQTAVDFSASMHCHYSNNQHTKYVLSRAQNGRNICLQIILIYHEGHIQNRFILFSQTFTPVSSTE